VDAREYDRLETRRLDCTVSAAFELTSTAEEFRLTEVLRAKKGDQEIFKREQFSSIRHDLL
jgi:hypothetical protein